MPSANPFWFGHYMGDKPIPQRPGYTPPPPPPIVAGDMGLEAALDQAISVVEAPVELPKQAWDLLIADWKQQFTVTGVASRKTGGDILVYEAEEGADVAGVNPSINLVDLVVNPKEALGKMISGALASLNPVASGKGNALGGELWGDLETSLERSMWKSLISEPKADKPFLYDWLEKSYAIGAAGGSLRLTGQGIFATEEAYGTDFASGGVKLSAVGGHVDVYEQAAENLLDFVAKKKSVIVRNGAFVGMETSFIKAVATELEQKKATILTAVAADPAAFVDGIETSIEQFLAEAKVAEAIGDFSGSMLALDKKFSMIKPTKVPTASDLQIAVTARKTGLADCITNLNTNILNAKAAYTGSVGDAFSHDIAGIEKVLQRAHTLQTKIENLPGDPSRLQVEAMVSELALIRGSLFNLRYGGGAQGSYLTSVTRRHLKGPKSLLAVDFVDSSGNQIMSQGYRSVGTAISRLERNYWYNDGWDLVKAVLDGKLGRDYIWWGMVTDRIQMFTPKYWTGKLMASTHAFGLNYNEKWDGKEIAKIFNTNPMLRPNKFKVKFSPTTGGVSTGVFTGGEHIGTVFNAWNASKKGLLLAKPDAVGNLVHVADPGQKAFLALLNGDPGAFLAGNPGAQYFGVLTSIPVVDKATLDNIKKFRLMLKDDPTKGVALGLKFIGDKIDDSPLNLDENLAILEGLFGNIKDIKDTGISPFVSKFGALQWASAKLTAVQRAIFARIGKYVAPFFRARAIALRTMANAAAKVLGGLLTKLGLGAALGAATGGLGALLVPWIEKVLQAVLSKLADKFKEAIKAVVQGDVVGMISRNVDDSLATMQKVITCGCFVPAFFAMAAIGMMGVLVGAISPIDSSVAPAATAGGGGTPVTPPGPPTTGGSFFKEGCNRAGPICGSFRDGKGCHGGNGYWALYLPPKKCSFNIPIDPIHDGPSKGTDEFQFGGPEQIECAIGRKIPLLDEKNTNASYGYAADYSPNDCTDADKNTIYMPDIDGITQWEVVGGGTLTVGGVQNRGDYNLLRNVDGAYDYRIALLHLQVALSTGVTVNTGDSIGALYVRSGWNPHVHAELKDGSTILEPETKID